ncbi:alpha/beta hydrolase [Cytobacillus gottheilii]|uniref:alpha/beta hydrolase n=1 Tax=Cytobacillus gottheilii TaxID=859144 RepID=UPI0009BBCFA6|nr:alpha/beta hydrolase-fold protein [Cytobacillus gottheilii]
MSSNKIEKWELAAEEQNYQMMVSIPKTPVPAEGFPVMYILDGNAFFTMFTEMVELQLVHPEKTGIPPLILVGIGYPGEERFHSRRFADYTTPVDEKNIPLRPDGNPWPESGKAAQFLSFLTDKIQKEIQRKYPIDVRKQTLFGHSLGGLFTLYTLFQKPNSFQNYFVSSPSIWWDQKSIMNLETEFTTNSELKNPTKLFITAGTEEMAGEIFEDSKAMYERRSLISKINLETEFFAGAGENHMSNVPAAFSRGLRFLL